MNKGPIGNGSVQSGTKQAEPASTSWIGRMENAAKNDWKKVKTDWHDGKHLDATFDFVTLPQQTFVDGIAKPAMTRAAHTVAHGAKEVVTGTVSVFNKEFVIVGGGLLIAGYVVIKGMQQVNTFTSTVVGAV